jgi:hypothetical protein
MRRAALLLLLALSAGSESVAGNAAQMPELQYVQNSGHDQGMFIFERR